MDRSKIFEKFTTNQYDQLIRNGSPENYDNDHNPVVKLFLPGTGCTWLITEISYRDTNLGFGLCDLGMGFPEMGYFDFDELGSTISILGLSVEKEEDFVGKYPLSIYADAARMVSRITDDDTLLLKLYTNKPKGNRPD